MMSDTIIIGAQGRIVLPAATRSALGLSVGERLSIRVDGRALILQRPEDAVETLRGIGRALDPGRSLVDELLAERRAEVAVE